MAEVLRYEQEAVVGRQVLFCIGILVEPDQLTLRSQLFEDGPRVAGTIPRDGLWRAQTPQVFRYGLLRRALAGMPEATDESQAVEALGLVPRIVRGEDENLKVTFAGDLPLAEMILARRGGGAT